MQVARPTDDKLASLLDKFVCVRVVQANGMDLSLFQFDYDLTFAAFFLNADRTIYGRYGTRPGSRSPDKGVSADGFIAALEGALALHADYPHNRASLAGKSGRKMLAQVPEDFGMLSGVRPLFDLGGAGGQIANDCIHCHEVGSAQALEYRRRNLPVPERILFPFPMPDRVGMTLATDEAARVTRVSPDSPAARAGFEKGDRILRFAGQPILSIADVQWVLDNAGDPAEIPAVVGRGAREVELTMKLARGWRRPERLSWRMLDGHLSLSPFPQLALGGLRVRELTREERRKHGIEDTAMALVQDSSRGRGGRRGRRGRRGSSVIDLERDDIIIGFDGIKKRMTEADLLAYCLQRRKPGDFVPIAVLRDGKRADALLELR